MVTRLQEWAKGLPEGVGMKLGVAICLATDVSLFLVYWLLHGAEIALLWLIPLAIGNIVGGGYHRVFPTCAMVERRSQMKGGQISALTAVALTTSLLALLMSILALVSAIGGAICHRLPLGSVLLGLGLAIAGGALCFACLLGVGLVLTFTGIPGEP